MLAETAPSYQTLLDEQKAQSILWIIEWILNHPWMSLLIVVGLFILVYHIIVPLVIKLLRKLKITKTGNWEYAPSEHLSDKITTSEIPHKRISIMPAPNPDPNSGITVLPSELEDLVRKIENGQHGDRTRCCVHCKNTVQAKALGVLFYHRMKESTAIDHHGWICYKKQYDEPLNIQNCFFRSLRIFNAINDRDNRFIRQIDFFCKENQHTLLIVYMQQEPDENDDRFEQLNALPGLSVVLFSDQVIPGFQPYPIKMKGGNTR